MSDTTHQQRILDQFTRQATPFSTAQTITDANALRMIVEAAAPRPDDAMLDVACGGGIVVCAFAPHVKHATGIDMTPAMLDRAGQLAAEKGIGNVSWYRVMSAPCPMRTARSISWRRGSPCIIPSIRSACCARWCALCAGRTDRGDRHVRLDDPAKAAEWNRAGEAARSVACAVPDAARAEGMFGTAGLPTRGTSFYELRDEIRNLLARSFPNPGDDAKIIEMFAASAEDDRLGIPVRREGDRMTTPIRSPFWPPTGCQPSRCELPHYPASLSFPRKREPRAEALIGKAGFPLTRE